MKKTSRVLWGIIVIALGVLFALNALEITDINLFFDGWWTLFIIVPCVIGLFTDHNKVGQLIGIGIGVFLLLCCQDIISFKVSWKLFVPAIIIIVGLRMVFGGLFDKKTDQIVEGINASGKKGKVGCAIFSGCDMNFEGEAFEGAELTAVFGGVACDLKKAVIERDCVIQATAIFGGIDIFVPEGVNVIVSSLNVFGGVSNEATCNEGNAVTIYVKSTCIFGGIDIK